MASSSFAATAGRSAARGPVHWAPICPVTGTWREGYVELSFTGQWPKELAVAPPAPVKTTLAGWIDGTAGKGRMKIEARADGQWTATRMP